MGTGKRTCQDCGNSFEAGPWARWCPRCRPEHRRAKRHKYLLTDTVKQLLEERYDSKVRGRSHELARQLGWPVWAVKRTAQKLGLARPWPKDRRDWTAEEVDFLQEWTGRRSAHWIARRLGRGETSVVLKMKRLSLSRRIQDGYCVRDLCKCFGVDHHTVERWIRLGHLGELDGRHTRRGSYDELRFCEHAVFAFITRYPLEFRLDQVDQVWFMGLVSDPSLRSSRVSSPEALAM